MTEEKYERKLRKLIARLEISLPQIPEDERNAFLATLSHIRPLGKLFAGSKSSKALDETFATVKDALLLTGTLFAPMIGFPEDEAVAIIDRVVPRLLAEAQHAKLVGNALKAIE